jgi:hypothetical protein
MIAEQLNGSSKQDERESNAVSAEDWYSELPETFAGGWLTTQEVVEGLAKRGFTVSYSSAYQWLKRAVARGAYKKRGKKYKPLPGDGDA